ncbi:uncharacterized protein LOC110189831 [Drosophila serrata]|uniref:uncharacterized protein LOC110189831 n=1 Tax=Drosophila serrata TaxID=7274 RepID=UPI000A1D3127|nr:uncharacterized protein LOC110189831 [Drosophila serrata]
MPAVRTIRIYRINRTSQTKLQVSALTIQKGKQTRQLSCWVEFVAWLVPPRRAHPSSDASSTFRGITHLRHAGAYSTRSSDWPISPQIYKYGLGANSSTARMWPQPGMRLHQGCPLLGTDNVGGGEALRPQIGHDWLTRNFPRSPTIPTGAP